MALTDLMEEFEKQEKLHTNEGRRGVENLCRIVRAMGYKDHQNFGQFQGGCYGDLIEFLEDNSGCIEAIKEWICDQVSPEWEEELESHLDARDEDMNDAFDQNAADADPPLAE
jgi:hypothetical protein